MGFFNGVTSVICAMQQTFAFLLEVLFDFFEFFFFFQYFGISEKLQILWGEAFLTLQPLKVCVHELCVDVAE